MYIMTGMIIIEVGITITTGTIGTITTVAIGTTETKTIIYFFRP
jgi:hypothetical protein